MVCHAAACHHALKPTSYKQAWCLGAAATPSGSPQMEYSTLAAGGCRLLALAPAPFLPVLVVCAGSIMHLPPACLSE